MDQTAIARCPWCSAVLADAAAPTCASCGAALVAATDEQIPGLTTVAPDARVAAKPVRRNRLLSWLSAEPSDESIALRPPEGALVPPPDHVRLEIRRLEQQALIARGEVPVEGADGAEAAAPASDDSAGDSPSAPPAAPDEDLSTPS